MRFFLANFFFLITFYSFGCKCESLSPITAELTKGYDVIFIGSVDSVGPCGKEGISTAYFTILELYKGSVSQHVRVDFDCASSCLMSFEKGEQWLMYTTFQKFDMLTVTLCTHSRKFFADAMQDYYAAVAARTFEQEKQFLKTTLGIKTFAVNNQLNDQQKELKPHNDQPSNINKLVLVLISILTMTVVYFFSRKKK